MAFMTLIIYYYWAAIEMGLHAIRAIGSQSMGLINRLGQSSHTTITTADVIYHSRRIEKRRVVWDRMLVDIGIEEHRRHNNNNKGEGEKVNSRSSSSRKAGRQHSCCLPCLSRQASFYSQPAMSVSWQCWEWVGSWQAGAR